jgi:integrase
LGQRRNELWCTDYPGEFLLGNRQYCYALTVTDHASRFLLSCEALASAREHLEALNSGRTQLHSFRRSLASNLYSLGVKPALIQALLRHSDIHTTLSYYVEVSEKDVKDALDELNKLMR